MGMYMCIDLKCFYASVECADLGLDGEDVLHLNYLRAKNKVIVIFVAIQEDNDIRILLEGARFTKVRKHRPFIWSAFNTTR